MKTYFDGKVENGKFIAWDNDKFREAFHQFEGGTVRLTLEKGNKRSNEQNRYYWGVIVEGIWRKFTEMGYTYTRDDIHAMLKDKFLQKKVIEVPNKKTGEIEEVVIPGSTTELTTTEMNEDFFELIIVWCAEYLDLVIESPGNDNR